jgi:uncharacterized protein
MTHEPDHGFGLLSSEDENRLEGVLHDRSEGAYGVPAVHGMLTASVVGPKSVPLDWILKAVLSGPHCDENGFDHFPEFSWVTDKIGELLLRIGRVMQQNPEMFRLAVYRSNLKKDDITPDPRAWCLGFVEAMIHHQEDWEPLLSTERGFLTVAPIIMTVDPNGWGAKDDLNPYKRIAPSKLCEKLNIATRAIYAFWLVYHERRSPSRTSVAPGRNAPCYCGSGRKFKRCCGARDGRAT